MWRLRQPTLILAGDDDPIIPLVNARIMHRLIPDSTLHVYSGGHLELAVDTERIVRVVEAFLSPEEPRMAQVASEHSGNRSGRTSSEVTGLPGEIIEGKVPLRSISQADIMPERRASAAAASLARP